jgi:hypothetical protein
MFGNFDPVKIEFCQENSKKRRTANNVVLLCGERRVKKHCFHEWGRKKSRVAKATSGFWSPHK